MPIYEYSCRACGKEFEALVARDSTLACPSCKGSDLQKKFSVFTVASAETRGDSARGRPCAECPDVGGSGTCPFQGS